MSRTKLSPQLIIDDNILKGHVNTYLVQAAQSECDYTGCEWVSDYWDRVEADNQRFALEDLQTHIKVTHP